MNKENQKIRNQKVNRFRNGYIEDWANSVDIEEIVRTGGQIVRIFEGIIYEENFSVSPFRSFIHKLFNLRLKYKGKAYEEDNVKYPADKNNIDEVGDELIKLLMNSLYGKTVQRDIETEMHIWGERTLKDNYDDTILSRFEIGNKKWIVEKKKETNKIDVVNPKNKSPEVPIHLGSFILSHSRRIMNNFLLEIDAYKKPIEYYKDTDSTYISKIYYNQLDKAKHVGSNLGQGKNDYGNGGIIFGLYEAPKVKYNIILNEGILSEKKTFKGYNSDILQSDEFFKLHNKENVESTMTKPWTRDFQNGVRISPDEESQTKIFTHNLNELKRQPPDENGIMYPYYNETKACHLNYLEFIPTPTPQLDLEKVFQKCTKCKEIKSSNNFYPTMSWCKTCMNENTKQWLRNTPNAQIADNIRRLPLSKESHEWLEFSKKYFIPNDYKGQIDIDHFIPLSKFDLSKEENIKQALDWKNLRYMTHADNMKKKNNLPTEQEINQQNHIINLFLNSLL